MLKSLAAEVQTHRPRVANAGYPASLRARVRQAAVVAIDEGHSQSAIALSLGLSDSTLSRWLHAESQVIGFRRVDVEQPTSVPVMPPKRTLSLRTPTGYLVEGLDLIDVVDILGHFA